MKKISYNPNRRAALLKFKPGVTEQEIARALNSIKNILDLPDSGYEQVNNSNGTVSSKKVPFRWSHVVHSYDEEYGSPVFYIP